MYYVYILKSLKYDLHYIGHTSNLEDRLKRHNQNRNKFTMGKGPWELIASAQCSTKSNAYQLELKLKSFKNFEYAINYIKNFQR